MGDTAIDFKAIFAELLKEAEVLAEKTLKNYVKEAKGDSKDILNKMKADLERWTLQLAAGELSKDDFIFLVKGQKDLMEMVALKRAGITAITLNEFRDSLITMVTGSLLKAIKI